MTAAAWPTLSESTSALIGIRTRRSGDGERAACQPRPFGAEEHGHPIGDLDRPEILGGRRRCHRPHLETCGSTRCTTPPATVRRRSGDRHRQYLTHAHPNGATAVGVGARRIDQRGRRSGTPWRPGRSPRGSRCRSGPRARRSVEHRRATRRDRAASAALGASDHPAMQIEPDHLGDHAALGDVHRHAGSNECIRVVGEPIDPRWSQQHGSDRCDRDSISRSIATKPSTMNSSSPS